MHADVRTALRDAINAVFSGLLNYGGVESELHWVCRRNEKGGVTTSGEFRPCFASVYQRSAVDWDALGGQIEDALRQHHPDHVGLVGTAATGAVRFSGVIFLGRMVEDVFRKCRTLEPDPSLVEECIDRVERFIDSETVCVRYIAPVLNLRIEGDRNARVTFPGPLVLRRLTDEEFDAIHSGPATPPRNLPFRPPSVFDDYAFVGTLEADKVLDDSKPRAQFDCLKEQLERAALVLRTFKDGPVGCGPLIADIDAPFPLAMLMMFFGEYVPVGTFTIVQDEIAALEAHARAVCGDLQPSLDVALSRLGDATNRSKPRDRLIDAVIGLESLLLAMVGNEKYRGELRYRFALHYSLLFDDPHERKEAYHVARDLYDHRSTLAHGGRIASQVQVGSETLSLHAAAQKGCDALRSTVKRFLHASKRERFWKADYWESRLFARSSDKLDPRIGE